MADMIGACGAHGEGENAWRLLVGKSEGKKSRWTPKCICEDNITMDLKRKRLDAVNWCACFKLVTGRRLL